MLQSVDNNKYTWCKREVNRNAPYVHIGKHHCTHSHARYSVYNG